MCSEGCGGVGVREVIDPVTDRPLGVLLCMNAVRLHPELRTRPIPPAVPGLAASTKSAAGIPTVSTSDLDREERATGTRSFFPTGAGRANAPGRKRRSTPARTAKAV